MRRSAPLWVFVGLLAMLVTASARADDVVRVIGESGASGKIVETSPTEIKVEKSVGGPVTIAVNKIESIAFDREPRELRQARLNIENGAYDQALEQLKAIDSTTLTRPLLAAEAQYLQALSAARIALAGGGDLKDAGTQMLGFLKQHPTTHHFFQANEVTGDLLVALGSHDAAQQYYNNVAKAPWPAYQMRASVASGRAQLAQNQADEAIKTFDHALSIAATASADQVKSESALAEIGKAAALVQQKKFDEAIQQADAVITKADPEATDLMAQAYIALGNAYRQQNKTKDALLAFLHVDVLYFSNPQAHAEALANLAVLWNEVGKPERGLQAKQQLSERYGASKWAAGK